MRYAVDATYQLSNNIKLRTSINYDQTLVDDDDDHRSISIPDSDRLWISGGLNYSIDNKYSIDFGVNIIQSKTENFTETDNLGQQ